MGGFRKVRQKYKAFCDKYLSPLNICDLVKVIESMIINDTFDYFNLGVKKMLPICNSVEKFF